MNVKAENTISALRKDLTVALEAHAGRAAFARNMSDQDRAAAKHLYEGKDALVEAILERLRRNWTVTERARSQRRVPPR